MKKNTAITTTTYTAMQFNVDIIVNAEEGTFEAWLYESGHGVKELMFGGMIDQQSYDDFVRIVYANLNEYIKFYIEDHMDE